MNFFNNIGTMTK
jgi:hypothetical protein